ncbi:Alpha/Beta hydrolase protein [Xylogone sp. PMI_703]|nr:Alpha/Beta hydrolase protein [Xylogone sp. PMI_703]
MERHSLQHTKLNIVFEGIQHPHSKPGATVSQFRGIKYATIPARWRQSKLFEDYPERHDVTKYGPACPQFQLPVAVEDILNGIDPRNMDAIKTDEPCQYDELECLNLNISIPSRRSSSAGPLPVMICIHGGGLVGGRNSSWFVDGGAFVSRSIDIGKSIIFVTLNYRLGSLGFLASKELLADNLSAGDEGVGNYGPHDVYNGMEWVYRNISGFGGDPDNITIVGESAGAFSVLMQIHLQFKRRFRRAIIQSGQIDSCTLAHPATLEEQQRFYDDHLRILNVNSLEEMRKLPVSDFHLTVPKLQKFGTVCCRITIDNIHYSPSWREFGASGLEIIVGDTAHESTLFDGLARSGNLGRGKQEGASEQPKFGLKDINERFIQVVFDVYGIHPELNQEDILDRLWQIVSDSSFAEPTERFASSATEKGAVVYRYLFDQINAFGGSYYNRAANHAIELPYIYGPDGIFEVVENLSQEQRISSEIQYKWLQFVYGEGPWNPFNEGRYYVFGPEGEVGEIDSQEFRKRRRIDKWPSIRGLSFSDRWQLVVHTAGYAKDLVWGRQM